MWKKSAQPVPTPTVPTPPPSYHHAAYAVPPPPLYTNHGGGGSSWGPFLSICLEITLWYFNFIHPIYISSKLIQKVPAPNAREVSNCVVAFALLWFLEIGDQLLLRDFIAMRNVYVIARIFFCMYLLHPRFQGALHIYERWGVRNLVDNYGGAIDVAVTQNISFIKNNGAVEYAIKLFQFVLGGVSEILYIVKQLMLPLPPQEEGVEAASPSTASQAASPSSLASTNRVASGISSSSAASPASQPRSTISNHKGSPSAFVQTPPSARKSTSAAQSPSRSPSKKDRLTASLLHDEDEGGAPSVPASGSARASRTPSGLTAATVAALTNNNRSRAGTLRSGEDSALNFDDTLYSFANTQVGELHERMFEGVTPRERY